MLTTFDLHNCFWPLVFVWSQKHVLHPHLYGTDGKMPQFTASYITCDFARHLIKWVVMYTCHLKVNVLLNLMNWLLLIVISDEVVVVGLASWWFPPCLLYTQQELYTQPAAPWLFWLQLLYPEPVADKSICIRSLSVLKLECGVIHEVGINY